MKNTAGKGKIHPVAQAIMNLTPEQKEALATHLSTLPINPPSPEMLNPALHYLQVMNAAKMNPAVPAPAPATGAPMPPPAAGAPPAPPMAQPAPTVQPVAPTLTQEGQQLGLADLTGLRKRNPYLNFGTA